MQKLLFTFFVLILAMPTFGQNPGDLKVSLGTGLYNAKLVESTPRSFYSFDMDYHVSQKHVLSAGFLKAKVFYLDTEWTNVPLEDTWWWWNEKNNAKFETYNFAVLYKYLALNRHRTQVFLGTGFSINMLRYEYSFRYTPQNVGPAVQAFDLPVFPFRLEIDYTISNSVRFGLLGGIHFEPDDGFNGKYAGVRLGYLIRQNVREN